jgi:hypothetical protein
VAANSKQGSYLAIFLIGFTAFPAGLVVWSSSTGLGLVLVLAGLALMLFSLAGFRRIKPLEFSE